MIYNLIPRLLEQGAFLDRQFCKYLLAYIFLLIDLEQYYFFLMTQIYICCCLELKKNSLRKFTTPFPKNPLSFFFIFYLRPCTLLW